ncbi:MAG: aliphatic sulfonate ABC transporter substrate-binding protein [Oscillatoriaceae bacterium SKW80]|nr:aliphatic sulfonate ABC transporter substrate-binding protein [Oscillatoriaceae bacterium SKYG93]MCX8121871.1 aliphatic sulfonate ABC transporter substrate-binding protein [Oscillatoriaceae bacterium SKW80]MDW8454632.1 aliphatic sulfonate ABC transporter substrate-binding protein [Oscillatoriaceae cyanobacterium SKYGB_i_bin93]HIK27442.1 aliphatic sulfonate ABC transporter substrate-binding protein [Oscillatoriaceae cyanobacterium M7585_C2015_266]
MKIQKLLLLFIPLLVGFIVAVSCTPSQNPNSTISRASPQAISPIRLGFCNWPAFLIWQVAKEENLFAENQIDVDLKYYSYSESLKAIAEGKLDANNQNLSDTISLMAKFPNFDPVIILNVDTSYGGDAIIVSKEINKIADLKGKKVATLKGGIEHYLLLLGLKKAGIKPTDIELIDLDESGTVAAFVEKQVDAAGVFIPYTFEALKRPGSKILFSSKDFPNAIPDIIVVNRELIEKRPEDVQLLVKTWFDTLKHIRENPEKSYKIMADYIGVSIGEFQKYISSFQIINIEENLKVFQDSGPKSLPYLARQISQFLLDTGMIKKKPDLSKLFDSRFIKNYAESIK